MPNKHKLSLEVPVSTNPSVLRVIDASVYSPDLQVTCAILKIKSPGFTNPIIIEVNPGFNLNLCACNLGIVTTGCDSDYSQLPDGLYEIEYSVSPNDIVYTFVYHLRTTIIRAKLHDLICGMGLSACTPPTLVIKRWNDISEIEMFVKGAEVMASKCGEPSKAVEILQYSYKLLDRLTCKNC